MIFSSRPQFQRLAVVGAAAHGGVQAENQCIGRLRGEPGLGTGNPRRWSMSATSHLSWPKACRATPSYPSP